MPTLIFVYGSLKRGLSNHHWLAGQHFVAEARTAPGYQLFDLGEYPGMVTAAETEGSVWGELWEVDDDGLAGLDVLEGVDEGMYERVAVSLLEPFAGTAVETYLYRESVAGRAAVLGGKW